MMMQPDDRANVIILGGGCAGLSLASRLAMSQSCPKVTVVEARSTYTEDRTWCGWRTRPHFFADCVEHEWQGWQVVSPQGTSIQRSQRYPYEMVSAGLFYNKAQALLSRNTQIELLLGTTVAHVCPKTSSGARDGDLHVQLTNGRMLQAPWIIDTRPATGQLCWPWIWQHFVGYVVELDERHKRSLGILPTLMDFQAEEGHVAQFVYILPISPTKYLVEWTRLSTSKSSYQGQLTAIEVRLNLWLENRLGSNWQRIRRESGSLPMAVPVKDKMYPGLLHAGMRGGSMRASSGYAFHAIQRWADDCSQSLLLTGRPVAPTRNRFLEALDASFLSVLQKEPGAAWTLFAALFAKCPADSLVRFLTGQPELDDYWPVVASLPWRRFVPSLPAAISEWCRI